jgi:hypothetical protein
MLSNNNFGKAGAIALAVAAVAIAIIFFAFFTFTDSGKNTIKAFMSKQEPQVNITNNIYENKTYVGNIEIATKLLNKKTAEKYNLVMNQIIQDYTQIKSEVQSKNQTNSFAKINVNEKYSYKLDKLEARLGKLEKITKIHNNTDRVIKVSIDNVGKMKPFRNSIKYKKDFFLAKLEELKKSLSDDYLSNVNRKEGSKIFAQLAMMKSISYYLEYEPAKAFYYYEQAKKAYPTLKVINELKKEYRDIAPKNAKELRYAYISLASVPKNKENMDKTPDEILSPTKAYAIRQHGYNLYLSVDYKVIKVYTILEYREDLEKISKLSKLKNIEKTAYEYDDTNKLPKEYRYMENRKKIYIYNSSGRNGDRNLVKRLEKRHFQHLEAKGEWKGKKFSVYAIYYDGNSCDKNDLDSFLEETKKIIGSYAIRQYAYQQSKSKTIKHLFKDEYLKYVVVLEKNANIKDINCKKRSKSDTNAGSVRTPVPF